VNEDTLERKKTSLSEQILGLPPSGLKLDGNPSGQECVDIFDYLEELGLKSANEKITYLKKIAISSEGEYLKNVGVTNKTLEKVVECIQYRQETLYNAKHQNESFEKATNFLFRRDVDRQLVQQKILKELKNSSGIQQRTFWIAVAAFIIAVVSLLFTFLKI